MMAGCSTHYKQKMSLKQQKRDDMLDRMVEHVLAHGLGGASLRPLAAAAGTSDRMLLYYFTDKDEIILAIFGAIALRFGAMLMQAVPDRQPSDALTLRADLYRVFRTDAARPFIQVYLELCVAASRGEQPHRLVAAQLARASIAWAGEQLNCADDERERLAALTLATVDGLWLLDAIGVEGMEPTA
jgi:AcrR family transcriptional regulator